VRRALAIAVVAACSRGEPPTVAPSQAPAPPKPKPAETITEPHRKLTPGERAMLEPLFHASLRYDDIHVIDAKFLLQPSDVYMTPHGNIYAPGELYEADFSAPTVGVGRAAVFVHEITHVWQFENGMDLVAQGLATLAAANGAYERAYPYTLERGRDLVDYGMEQQASIVEDYFAMTVQHRAPQRIENPPSAPREELYAAVLANFLRDPRYAHGMAAKEIAERHAAAAKGKPPGQQTCDTSEKSEPRESRHMCAWRFRDDAAP
jgi:hypothetical protein